LTHAQTAIAHANVDLYRGDATSAARRIDDALPRIEKIGIPRFQLPRIELAILRARIALADHARPIADRANEVRALCDSLGKEGAGWVTGVNGLLRAAVHVMQGDPDLAIPMLAVAEEQLAHAGMAGYVQVARLRRGELEGGAGGAARAAAARDLLNDLGAVAPDHLAQLLVPWAT
jgi:hypothetical protein